MRNIVTGALLVVGLLIGTATASFGSQRVHIRETPKVVHEVGNIHRADYYYYHHHRYHHRAWDRHHHRWRYW